MTKFSVIMWTEVEAKDEDEALRKAKYHFWTEQHQSHEIEKVK